MSDERALDGLTAETVDLLQVMIRNACVNDGTAESGHEIRNSDVLEQFLGGTGLDVQTYEPTPGRTTLVARIEGTDPDAPSLCLMGHTDVVPVNREGWTRDPFGGELVDGEVWGRGAVDMLNLTSSMAVAFRHLARTGFRPKGDLDLLRRRRRGVGQRPRHAMDGRPRTRRRVRRLRAHRERWAALRTQGTAVGRHQRGGEGRRLAAAARARERPVTVSAPFKANNALMTAAAVIQRHRRLSARASLPRAVAHPRRHPRRRRGDPRRAARPRADRRVPRRSPGAGPGRAPARVHAHDVLVQHHRAGCAVRRFGHTDEDQRDPRLRRHRRRHPHPAGRGPDDVDAHLRAALGDLYDRVEVRDRDERSGLDQPRRHAAVGRARTVDREAVPDRTPHPAARGRLHRLARLPARWVRSPTAPGCSAPTSTRPTSVVGSTATTNASTSSRCG